MSSPLVHRDYERLMVKAGARVKTSPFAIDPGS